MAQLDREALKALRKARGESQGDLARAVGVTRGLISLFEIGLSDPSIGVALRIAAHYDVPVERLFTPEPAATGPPGH